MPKFAALILFALAIVLSFSAFARAQFDDDPKATGNLDQIAGSGPKLDSAATKQIKIGVRIKASGGPCHGIICTVPVPTDWPEQKVKQIQEDISPSIRTVSYRTLDGSVKQMIIKIPDLVAGEEAHALVTFEITRASIQPPEDTTVFRECPKDKIPRDVLPYLSASPEIESAHPKIIALARETIEGKGDWEKVQAIYDVTRQKIKYQNGPLKGALKGLTDGTGDCEELTSLFIAMCRATGIPARTVWVPDHCYPEFYMVDGQGNGYWFPCQAAGSAAFGGIPEHRPIMQKGDCFRDPDRPEKKLRYVSEFLKGVSGKNANKPQVDFVRDWN
ncbi:MAG TPA: transglutaminase domain-containing protein [Pirellulales bacterium]